MRGLRGRTGFNAEDSEDAEDAGGEWPGDAEPSWRSVSRTREGCSWPGVCLSAGGSAVVRRMGVASWTRESAQNAPSRRTAVLANPGPTPAPPRGKPPLKPPQPPSGRPGDCSPGPPADPDVRNSRIRLLASGVRWARQNSRCTIRGLARGYLPSSFLNRFQGMRPCWLRRSSQRRHRRSSRLCTCRRDRKFRLSPKYA